MSVCLLRPLSNPFLLATLMVGCAPLALAQETPHTLHLPPVTTTGTLELSLTAPSTPEARRQIERTPGGVDLVPDTEFKNGPANTVRDVLGWVPGVVTQPKSNIDNRISIRGSGLTRNYGNRGVNLYMDGIPINTAEGLTDVFEIDPSAYRHAEVYKGANALRFGANALGGAVNFATPTGYDASAFDARLDTGSFGFLRSQASTGGVSGPFDYFVNLSAQREDGFRDHSSGHVARGNANVGYRFSADAETRFYLNANSWRQDLPGELTKSAALNNPRQADPAFVTQNQQRNIDSVRVANKTALRFDDTNVEFGLFTHQRHVDHPIFRYLDFDVADYGGFTRATDERMVGGFRNRLTAGINIHAGTIDYQEYANVGNATKGALLRSELQKSQNYSLYADNAFYVLEDVALVLGGQFLHAVREKEDRFLTDGNQTASRSYTILSPKVGFLWDVDPQWQTFANVSHSAEVPTFDAATFTVATLPTVEAQTAVTYEVGTRGRRSNLSWDLSVYRANVSNELQCLVAGFATCSVVNAHRTVHQGVEIGAGAVALDALFSAEDKVWFNLAYTYSDFHFDSGRYDGNSLPGVPEHLVRAELLYRHPSGFYAGPNVEWMPGGYYADNANTLKVDAYELLNFRLGLEQGTGWSGYVEGRNLLDKRYISASIIAETANAASALFSPGYGRAVYAGLRYTW